MSAGDPTLHREVAHRIFAAEFEESTVEITEGEAERAPKYVISPTGARINRLFVVGVVTEIEWVNDDVIRARIVDPTGAFVMYAGQYQPDSLNFLERIEPPTYVAVTGKANVFQPEGSDRIFTSIRPETLNSVDAETRDRWIVDAATHTLERADRFAAALSTFERITPDGLLDAGYPESAAHGIAVASTEYGTTPGYLGEVREMALDALRLVAGEIDSVSIPSIRPNEPGDDPDLDDLRLPPERRFEPSAPGADEAPSSSAQSEEAPTETAESTEPADRISADSPDDGMAEADAETEIDADLDGDSPDVPMYELDADERESVEDEFGTDFKTGAEVETESEETDEGPTPPPDSEESTSVDGESISDDTGAPAPEPTESGETDVETKATAEPVAPDEDQDLVEVVMETMRDLADGGPAERDILIESIVSSHAVEPDTIEDAIQDALMSGRCYEPDDGYLRPI